MIPYSLSPKIFCDSKRYMAFTTMNDDKLLFVDKIAHAPPFLNGGGGSIRRPARHSPSPFNGGISLLPRRISPGLKHQIVIPKSCTFPYSRTYRSDLSCISFQDFRDRVPVLFPFRPAFFPLVFLLIPR